MYNLQLIFYVLRFIKVKTRTGDLCLGTAYIVRQQFPPSPYLLTPYPSGFYGVQSFVCLHISSDEFTLLYRPTSV